MLASSCPYHRTASFPQIVVVQCPILRHAFQQHKCTDNSNTISRALPIAQPAGGWATDSNRAITSEDKAHEE